MADVDVKEGEHGKKSHLRIGKPVDIGELRRMPRITRSKFYIYSEPPQQISEAQMASQKRVKDANKKLQKQRMHVSMSELPTAERLLKNNEIERDVVFQNEKLRHERLIGQLKAAEARNRIRMIKMRYLNNREDDIEYLIECQPTAIKAVRLEAFLPQRKKENFHVDENLTPIERRRLEALIDDNNNSLVTRRY